MLSNGPPTALPLRKPLAMPSSSQIYASPTGSEFSDGDDPDSVKNWNEEQVCEYLRSVSCGEYEKIFRKNHINGENLLEMDKEVLKEMGIDKVGDRVRLFLGIKKLRTKAYANQKKRNRVRQTDGKMLEVSGTKQADRMAIGLFCWPGHLVYPPERFTPYRQHENDAEQTLLEADRPIRF